MRVTPVLVLLCSLPLTRPEAQESPRWVLVAGVEGLSFTGSARDTAAPVATAAGLAPAPRLGLQLAIHRRLGPWSVGLGIGWAAGHVEAANDAVAVRDRTVDLSRYRLAATADRVVWRPGGGELAAEAGPALHLWALDGDTRARLAVRAGLVLRLPLAGAAMEHRVALGVEASPLTVEDVGPEFELRCLGTVELGVGVRLPL